MQNQETREEEELNIKLNNRTVRVLIHSLLVSYFGNLLTVLIFPKVTPTSI